MKPSCILNDRRTKEGIPVVVGVDEDKADLEEQMTELVIMKVDSITCT